MKPLPHPGNRYPAQPLFHPGPARNGKTYCSLIWIPRMIRGVSNQQSRSFASLLNFGDPLSSIYSQILATVVRSPSLDIAYKVLCMSPWTLRGSLSAKTVYAVWRYSFEKSRLLRRENEVKNTIKGKDVLPVIICCLAKSLLRSYSIGSLHWVCKAKERVFGNVMREISSLSPRKKPLWLEETAHI